MIAKTQLSSFRNAKILNGMTHTCKNCRHEILGKFCHNCGQTANTHELNWLFLWHEIQHNFIHFEKGILFTSKELLTRPGNAIREFIEGKRVQHYKPIALVLLLAAIFTFLFQYFKVELAGNSIIRGIQDGGNASKKDNLPINLEDIREWTNAHYALQALLQIPFYALATFIFFRKSGYNYVQNFVLLTFITAQSLLVHILLFPLEILNKNVQFYYLPLIIEFVRLTFWFWTYVQFFNKYSKTKSLTLAVVSFLFSFILQILFVVIVMASYDFYLKHLH